MTEKYYYESLHINGTANTETVDTILTSTEEEHKFVDAIAFIEDTAVENHDAELVAYIEREKIIDVPISQNLRGWDSDVRLNTDPFYAVGHDLPIGQSLKVGHTSGATPSNIFYTVRYKIAE